jgi:chromosome segregation ATPase
MEPIRPDDDELRATRGSNTEQRQGKKPEKPGKSPRDSGKGGKGGGGGDGGDGGRKSSGPLFLIALLAVAVAGAAGWYQQNQRIVQMESQVEEADYWARQSKLALARFEGELSETGEDLQEAGQSIEQQLSDQSQRLDTADSEIRKLWGVANDRNKSRLNDHETRLKALDETVKEAASKRQALTGTLSELEKTLASELGTLESSLKQEIAAQGKRVDSQQAALDETKASVAAVDEDVENRLKRFQREQSLTIDGLEGRLSSLEKTAQTLSGGEIQSLRSELATLKQTVSSIDASRAQLTSRLVRLSEEVGQLRSQGGGQ